MDRNRAFYKMEKFTTDGLYLALHWAALRAQPKTFAYRFDVPSPFDNDWKGLAHHSLDNVYVWSLLKHMLPPQQQRVSEKMSEAWLRFANGQDPWERFDENRRFMVFSDSEAKMTSVKDDAERGYSIWEEIEKEELMGDFGRLATELCMRQGEICDPSVASKALKVDELVDLGISAGNQVGGLKRDID
jgi:carboxylesterase type B